MQGVNLESLLKIAKNKGIKLVVVDRNLAMPIEDLYNKLKKL